MLPVAHAVVAPIYDNKVGVATPHLYFTTPIQLALSVKCMLHHPPIVAIAAAATALNHTKEVAAVFPCERHTILVVAAM